METMIGPRQIGKTTAIINLLKVNKNSVCVTPTKAHGNFITKSVGRKCIVSGYKMSIDRLREFKEIYIDEADYLDPEVFDEIMRTGRLMFVTGTPTKPSPNLSRIKEKL